MTRLYVSGHSGHNSAKLGRSSWLKDNNRNELWNVSCRLLSASPFRGCRSFSSISPSYLPLSHQPAGCFPSLHPLILSLVFYSFISSISNLVYPGHVFSFATSKSHYHCVNPPFHSCYCPPVTNHSCALSVFTWLTSSQYTFQILDWKSMPRCFLAQSDNIQSYC